MVVTRTVKQAISNQPNDAEAVYRALIALGNMLYAAKQFDNPLTAEEVVKLRSTVEGVEKISFAPKAGQPGPDPATEKQKILNVAKEILSTL